MPAETKIIRTLRGDITMVGEEAVFVEVRRALARGGVKARR